MILIYQRGDAIERGKWIEPRQTIDEDWLEHMLRRDEELSQRLVITPPPLTAAARHYLDTNLYARDARSREIPRSRAGGLAGGRGLLVNGAPWMGSRHPRGREGQAVQPPRH
jgi:hypothetical protein